MTAYLASLTDAQLQRLYCNVWERMTRYDGYQPFGYDWPTIRAVHPEWARIIAAINRDGRRRLMEEKATNNALSGDHS